MVAIAAHDTAGADATTRADTATNEPTADTYVAWMIARCSRRRDSRIDHARCRHYEERVAILRCLQSALHSPVESLRVATLRTLGNMSDISDDEDSPNYRSINTSTTLAQAQRAYSLVRALQHGASSASSGGLNTNFDMVARALGRGQQYPPDSSSEEEIGSQVERRYMQSTQSEVFDPDLWAVLQYRENSEEENAMED